MQACSELDHAPTRAAITAERAVLAVLGGGCQVPIGAHAHNRTTAVLHLRAIVISPDGKRVVKSEAIRHRSSQAWATRVGQELLEKGAREILG